MKLIKSCKGFVWLIYMIVIILTALQQLSGAFKCNDPHCIWLSSSSTAPGKGHKSISIIIGTCVPPSLLHFIPSGWCVFEMHSAGSLLSPLLFFFFFYIWDVCTNIIPEEPAKSGKTVVECHREYIFMIIISAISLSIIEIVQNSFLFIRLLWSERRPTVIKVLFSFANSKSRRRGTLLFYGLGCGRRAFMGAKKEEEFSMMRSIIS